MLTFLDFHKEIKSGKSGNVYFIMAADNYFISKAGEILREKLFGSKDNKENFFLRYGDEDSAAEIIELCNNFSSLFSSSKVVILKRAEKLVKKLDELIGYSKKPDKDTVLLMCFDKNYVLEKKLAKEAVFYDFSELPDSGLRSWIKSEFEVRGCTINDDALDMFMSLVPNSFDVIETEIEKICTYSSGEGIADITKDVIQAFVGYSSEFSPEELIRAILKKNEHKAQEVLDYLLNKGGMNEIFLLSIIVGYYLDLISFKTKGFAQNDSYSHFGKYKMWGDRLKFAKSFHNLLDVSELKYSLSRLLEIDQKLKTSMLDSHVLFVSLISDLCKGS